MKHKYRYFCFLKQTGIVSEEKQETIGGVEMYRILNGELQAHFFHRMSWNSITNPIKGMKFLPYKGVCELIPWAHGHNKPNITYLPL